MPLKRTSYKYIFTVICLIGFSYSSFAMNSGDSINSSYDDDLGFKKAKKKEKLNEQKTKKRRLKRVGPKDDEDAEVRLFDLEDEEEASVDPILQEKRAIRPIEPLYSKHQIELMDVSEEEDNVEGPDPFPQPMRPLVDIGMRLKFLANVFLRNLDQTANIFVPRYTLVYVGGEKKDDYFRTPKGQICVFASGGLQNSWESTVGHVQKMLFGAKVKVIRASWIQKYLSRKLNKRFDLEKKYKGREQELHSELYFDLFFKNFFLPEHTAGGKQIHELDISAFSWWDVCDECERKLSAHRNHLPDGAQLTYSVASRRPYKHAYSPVTPVTLYRIPQQYETSAWTRIWQQVQKYVPRIKDTDVDFWTKTKDGLELCKWLGQAFVENSVTLSERTAKAGKKGDVLSFYRDLSEKETQGFKRLIEFLREVNWELSCWYKGRYPDKIQRTWKSYWRQLVIPHFDWEIVDEWENEHGEVDCEMCGYEKLHTVVQVFHPKFQVSGAFLERPEEEQRAKDVEGIYKKVPWNNLPLCLRKKREQSLFVGSKCVQTLMLGKGDIEKWLADHPREETERVWREREAREVANEIIDRDCQEPEKKKTKSLRKKRTK